MGTKIATWNIERLKHYRDIDKITQVITAVDADLLILTETDSRVSLPNYPYAYATPYLTDKLYKATENRVRVHSKYKAIGQAETSDPLTSICPVFETENGALAVYGTIMGIFGNRIAPFQEQVQQQTADIRKLSQTYKNICVAGDFNLSFCDNYYFTAFGRETVLKAFSECGIRILTYDVPECVDHIAVTDTYVQTPVSITEWNQDKVLSDHKGIAVEF